MFNVALFKKKQQQKSQATFVTLGNLLNKALSVWCVYIFLFHEMYQSQLVGSDQAFFSVGGAVQSRDSQVHYIKYIHNGR